ncbi:MAG: hypothetical protein R2857_14755 [Vampirovibrionales bacterium]
MMPPTQQQQPLYNRFGWMSSWLMSLLDNAKTTTDTTGTTASQNDTTSEYEHRFDDEPD